MGPHSLSICKGILEGPHGCLSFSACRGGACCHVGCGALVIPPLNTSRVEGAIGFKRESACAFQGGVEVLEGSVKVQCSYGQSVQGVMI